MRRADHPAFAGALEEHFPGAIEEREFLEASAQRLQAEGFSAANTLACVAVCRDEIAHPMIVDVDEMWGPVFSLASLAGLLTAGRTGLAAATAHIPIEDGRRHFVVYATPHIAIGEDGTIGQVMRPGLEAPSKACGALVAFRNELAAGSINLSIDDLDLEQSFLRMRLLPMVGVGEVPGLVELTKLAADAIEADLGAIFSSLMDDRAQETEIHGAFLTGIQIHGPGGINYVWPRTGHLERDGDRSDYDLTALAT